MPALNNKKHEAFAQAVALNVPQSQAYLEHVSGGKCSDRTAEVNGSTLAQSTEVALRIAELRKRVSDAADKKFDLTKEKWLDELYGIATDARQEQDYAAATGALTQIGKASSWYAPEKVEHSGSVAIPGLQEAVKQIFGK